MHWLVTASGRTEEAVDCILNSVEKNRNAEYIRLLHEIFKYGIQGHPYRGYIILQKNNSPKVSKKFFSGEKRPIWFVFSGLGSQWPAMGKLLMEIPIFAQSVRKSHDALRSKGLDVIKIISKDDPQILDNILNIFVGITAIQIGLVDVLSIINIRPDGIIGHSVGEIACGYADGCLTAEQTIMAAYYRGLVLMESGSINGTMAAVGESYETMKNLIPQEIDIACHNGPNSCTLSGPTDIMQNFIETLQEKNIFARKVNSANIPSHSRYIASRKLPFLSYLKKVIPEPKIRSKKWISTSALEHNWDNEEVKYCSAEYQSNNFVNPVYFEEGCHHIPDNAITIEIAPHGLLNAILKRSLPKTVHNIPLTWKNSENSVEYLLSALGQFYEAGGEMELSHLYPEIEFPVSRSTPMISPLIKWKYEEQQKPYNMSANTNQSNERYYTVDPNSEEYNYLWGHIIGDRNLYPGSGYLVRT
ncbi:fatty acid synthase-like [Planococcus citri]|uniref:fatty acid synthase-like n=1 Tax=Planococcus citri TaxID=170843 RepID=UPI0031F9AD07